MKPIRTHKLLIITAVVLAFSVLVAAEGKKTASTGTQQVAAFSALETKLMAAFQKRNDSTLNSMLSRDFEVWSPRPDGQPIARDEWLQIAPTDRPQKFQISHMAVRAFGDLHIASFVVNEVVSGQSHQHFIVDVWKGMGGSAKLQVRYESPQPGPVSATNPVPMAQ